MINFPYASLIIAFVLGFYLMLFAQAVLRAL